MVLRADREAEEYIYLPRTDYRRLLVFFEEDKNVCFVLCTEWQYITSVFLLHRIRESCRFPNVLCDRNKDMEFIVFILKFECHIQHAVP